MANFCSLTPEELEKSNTVSNFYNTKEGALLAYLVEFKQIKGYFPKSYKEIKDFIENSLYSLVGQQSILFGEKATFDELFLALDDFVFEETPENTELFQEVLDALINSNLLFDITQKDRLDTLEKVLQSLGYKTDMGYKRMGLYGFMKYSTNLKEYKTRQRTIGINPLAFIINQIYGFSNDTIENVFIHEVTHDYIFSELTEEETEILADACEAIMYSDEFAELVGKKGLESLRERILNYYNIIPNVTKKGFFGGKHRFDSERITNVVQYLFDLEIEEIQKLTFVKNETVRKAAEKVYNFFVDLINHIIDKINEILQAIYNQNPKHIAKINRLNINDVKYNTSIKIKKEFVDLFRRSIKESIELYKGSVETEKELFEKLTTKLLNDYEHFTEYRKKEQAQQSGPLNNNPRYSPSMVSYSMYDPINPSMRAISRGMNFVNKYSFLVENVEFDKKKLEVVNNQIKILNSKLSSFSVIVDAVIGRSLIPIHDREISASEEFVDERTGMVVSFEKISTLNKLVILSHNISQIIRALEFYANLDEIPIVIPKKKTYRVITLGRFLKTKLKGVKSKEALIDALEKAIRNYDDFRELENTNINKLRRSNRHLLALLFSVNQVFHVKKSVEVSKEEIDELIDQYNKEVLDEDTQVILDEMLYTKYQLQNLLYVVKNSNKDEGIASVLLDYYSDPSLSSNYLRKHIYALVPKYEYLEMNIVLSMLDSIIHDLKSQVKSATFEAQFDSLLGYVATAREMFLGHVNKVVNSTINDFYDKRVRDIKEKHQEFISIPMTEEKYDKEKDTIVSKTIDVPIRWYKPSEVTSLAEYMNTSNPKNILLLGILKMFSASENIVNQRINTSMVDFYHITLYDMYLSLMNDIYKNEYKDKEIYTLIEEMDKDLMQIYMEFEIKPNNPTEEQTKAFNYHTTHRFYNYINRLMGHLNRYAAIIERQTPSNVNRDISTFFQSFKFFTISMMPESLLAKQDTDNPVIDKIKKLIGDVTTNRENSIRHFTEGWRSMLSDRQERYLLNKTTMGSFNYLAINRSLILFFRPSSDATIIRKAKDTTGNSFMIRAVNPIERFLGYTLESKDNSFMHGFIDSHGFINPVFSTVAPEYSSYLTAYELLNGPLLSKNITKSYLTEYKENNFGVKNNVSAIAHMLATAMNRLFISSTTSIYHHNGNNAFVSYWIDAMQLIYNEWQLKTVNLTDRLYKDYIVEYNQYVNRLSNGRFTITGDSLNPNGIHHDIVLPQLYLLKDLYVAISENNANNSIGLIIDRIKQILSLLKEYQEKTATGTFDKSLIKEASEIADDINKTFFRGEEIVTIYTSYAYVNNIQPEIFLNIKNTFESLVNHELSDLMTSLIDAGFNMRNYDGFLQSHYEKYPKDLYKLLKIFENYYETLLYFNSDKEETNKTLLGETQRLIRDLGIDNNTISLTTEQKRKLGENEYVLYYIIFGSFFLDKEMGMSLNKKQGNKDAYVFSVYREFFFNDMFKPTRSLYRFKDQFVLTKINKLKEFTNKLSKHTIVVHNKQAFADDVVGQLKGLAYKLNMHVISHDNQKTKTGNVRIELMGLVSTALMEVNNLLQFTTSNFGLLDIKDNQPIKGKYHDIAAQRLQDIFEEYKRRFRDIYDGKTMTEWIDEFINLYETLTNLKAEIRKSDISYHVKMYMLYNETDTYYHQGEDGFSVLLDNIKNDRNKKLINRYMSVKQDLIRVRKKIESIVSRNDFTVDIEVPVVKRYGEGSTLELHTKTLKSLDAWKTIEDYVKNRQKPSSNFYGKLLKILYLEYRSVNNQYKGNYIFTPDISLITFFNADPQYSPHNYGYIPFLNGISIDLVRRLRRIGLVSINNKKLELKTLNDMSAADIDTIYDLFMEEVDNRTSISLLFTPNKNVVGEISKKEFLKRLTSMLSEYVIFLNETGVFEITGNAVEDFEYFISDMSYTITTSHPVFTEEAPYSILFSDPRAGKGTFTIHHALGFMFRVFMSGRSVSGEYKNTITRADKKPVLLDGLHYMQRKTLALPKGIEIDKEHYYSYFYDLYLTKIYNNPVLMPVSTSANELMTNVMNLFMLLPSYNETLYPIIDELLAPYEQVAYYKNVMEPEKNKYTNFRKLYRLIRRGRTRMFRNEKHIANLVIALHDIVENISIASVQMEKLLGLTAFSRFVDVSDIYNYVASLRMSYREAQFVYGIKTREEFENIMARNAAYVLEYIAAFTGAFNFFLKSFDLEPPYMVSAMHPLNLDVLNYVISPDFKRMYFNKAVSNIDYIESFDTLYDSLSMLVSQSNQPLTGHVYDQMRGLKLNLYYGVFKYTMAVNGIKVEHKLHEPAFKYKVIPHPSEEYIHLVDFVFRGIFEGNYIRIKPENISNLYTNDRFTGKLIRIRNGEEVDRKFLEHFYYLIFYLTMQEINVQDKNNMGTQHPRYFRMDLRNIAETLFGFMALTLDETGRKSNRQSVLEQHAMERIHYLSRYSLLVGGAMNLHYNNTNKVYGLTPYISDIILLQASKETGSSIQLLLNTVGNPNTNIETEIQDIKPRSPERAEERVRKALAAPISFLFGKTKTLKKINVYLKYLMGAFSFCVNMAMYTLFSFLYTSSLFTNMFLAWFSTLTLSTIRQASQMSSFAGRMSGMEIARNITKSTFRFASRLLFFPITSLSTALFSVFRSKMVTDTRGFRNYYLIYQLVISDMETRKMEYGSVHKMKALRAKRDLDLMNKKDARFLERTIASIGIFASYYMSIIRRIFVGMWKGKNMMYIKNISERIASIQALMILWENKIAYIGKDKNGSATHLTLSDIYILKKEGPGRITLAINPSLEDRMSEEDWKKIKDKFTISFDDEYKIVEIGSEARRLFSEAGNDISETVVYPVALSAQTFLTSNPFGALVVMLRKHLALEMNLLFRLRPDKKTYTKSYSLLGGTMGILTWIATKNDKLSNQVVENIIQTNMGVNNMQAVKEAERKGTKREIINKVLDTLGYSAETAARVYVIKLKYQYLFLLGQFAGFYVYEYLKELFDNDDLCDAKDPLERYMCLKDHLQNITYAIMQKRMEELTKAGLFNLLLNTEEEDTEFLKIKSITVDGDKTAAITLQSFDDPEIRSLLKERKNKGLSTPDELLFLEAIKIYDEFINNLKSKNISVDNWVHAKLHCAFMLAGVLSKVNREQLNSYTNIMKDYEELGEKLYGMRGDIEDTFENLVNVYLNHVYEREERLRNKYMEAYDNLIVLDAYFNNFFFSSDNQALNVLTKDINEAYIDVMYQEYKKLVGKPSFTISELREVLQTKSDIVNTAKAYIRSQFNNAVAQYKPIGQYLIFKMSDDVDVSDIDFITKTFLKLPSFETFKHITRGISDYFDRAPHLDDPYKESTKRKYSIDRMKDVKDLAMDNLSIYKDLYKVLFPLEAKMEDYVSPARAKIETEHVLDSITGITAQDKGIINSLTKSIFGKKKNK